MSEENGVIEDQSPQINELATALAKAQGQMEGAKKDALNPHFKNKYADLASVWDACRAPLSANGLAVVQIPGTGGKGVFITTLLMHSSGQFIRSRYEMPVSQPGPQGVGSALTYARRYALAAMVGVAPEDDDGNEAAGKSWGKPASNEPVLPPVAGRPETGKRTTEVKAKLASERKMPPIESVPPTWHEKIRELGKKHSLEGQRMLSHLQGCGIPKKDPAAYTEADFNTFAASVAYLNQTGEAT